MFSCANSNGGYDILLITSLARARLARSILKATLYAAAIALSILLIVNFGEQVLYFVEASVLAVLSTALLLKELTLIRIGDYFTSGGRLVRVHKEMTSSRIIASSSINLFGIRKYDKYTRIGSRLTLYFEKGGRMLHHQIEGVTQKQVEYYEALGEFIHITGTRFPVRVPPCGNEWICPFCGEFNACEKQVCQGCGCRIKTEATISSEDI